MSSGAPPPAPGTIPPAPGAEPAPRRTRASDIFDQSWLTSLLRPALILVLVACIDVVLGAVVARFVSGVAPWFARGLTLLAILAAAVSIASTMVMAQPSNRLHRSASYKAAELGLLLALTRLFVWAGAGGLPSLEQMLEVPFDVLVDPLFFVSAVIVSASWLIAGEVTEDLNQLALTADEIVIVEWRSDRNNDSMRASGIDRADVLGTFTLRWVTLGLALIVLVAMVRREMSFSGVLALMRQGIEPGVMAAVVLYFVAGLLLLSHGRLAMLRARWTLERTLSSDEVTRRWPLYVVLLVGGLALAAALLPFGDTFWLATILSWIIGGMFAFFLTVYQAAAWLMLWLASLLMGNPAPLPPTPVPTPPPAEPPSANGLPPLLPEWVGGTLFWVAIAALVAYAAFFYFREKGVRFGWLTWLWAMLRRRWQETLAVLNVRQRRPNPPGAPSRDARRPSRWRRGRFADADERIRYLYLATLEQAEEAGLARAPSETPLRYAPRLEELVSSDAETQTETQTGTQTGTQAAQAESSGAPDRQHAEAVHALTGAFLDVRYAGRHADDALAERMQHLWQELQKALRAHTRRGPE